MRKKRLKKATPVRRAIQDRNVPLPQKWDNFLAHSQNKADLARFLSQQLMIQAPSNKTNVVAGGFSNEQQVVFNA